MTIAEHGSVVLGDRYELQDLIATGGMGQVWRGRDLRLDRAVAVKVLRSEYADDPGFAARFRAEATHAAALSHPNIAAVHDYGESTVESTGEHIAYLVMELVDGDPLSALLSQDGPLDPDTAMSVLRQAAAALAEAHRAGLVHRDVKPANILVRPDGRVKLTDFGIAWSAASVPLTQAGQVIGTPQYMSPEQASGEKPRPASDVYALGLVGYEALTGSPAFDGDNPVTIALKQVQQEPAPMSPDVPEDVRSLIDAALTKDPDDRIPDGNAFLAAIDETLDHRGTDDGRSTRILPVAAPRTRPDAAVPVVPAPSVATTARTPAAATPTVGAAAAPAGSVVTAPAPVERRRAGAKTLLVVSTVLAVLLGAAVTGSALGFFSGEGAPTGAAEAAEAADTVPGSIVLTAEDHVGRPADDVEADLRALGLTVERRDRVTAEQPPGAVVALDPVGRPLAAGDEVRLDVAVAPPAPSSEAVVPAPAPAPAGSGDQDGAPAGSADPAQEGAAGTGNGTGGTPAGAGVADGTGADQEAGTPSEPAAATEPSAGPSDGVGESTDPATESTAPGTEPETTPSPTSPEGTDEATPSAPAGGEEDAAATESGAPASSPTAEEETAAGPDPSGTS
ncbi:protein kinase domain-containing protein [Blastococcus saxobsidens]|uniref:non-specific serine/threonine protein kinase n=1 Tax=Blastococcus saxobsidens TaxID=138336 RepID=A0A4Q7Y6S2_9ACTN|nr:protein kinase [Blastococcus saxobsidens]RZU31863.1 serine/threonine-protein kinase [Blastococcus saxobsidens]